MRNLQAKIFTLTLLLTIKILGLISGTLHPLEVALLPISGTACIGSIVSDWRTRK